MSISPVTPNTLKQWMDTQSAVLVDVREPGEYSSAHIDGSLLIPLGKLNKNALPDFSGKKLVIHCQKGGRGRLGCNKLLKEFDGLDVYNLEGGIEAWSAAGLPVITSGRNLLPLNQQVQLTIGLMLIIGSILGALYGRNFYLLTGVIGTGLAVAGITGFCGLARLLAIMPWNKR